MNAVELWQKYKLSIIGALVLFAIGLYIRLLNLGGASVQDAANILTAAAALTGAWIAWNGLSTWREQLEGNKNHEIAWMCLEKAYELRNAINLHVRNPAISFEESENARKAKGDSESTLDLLVPRSSNNAEVYDLRWKKLQAARDEFNASLVQAEIWWGDCDFVELRRPLNECIGELYINLMRLTGAYGIKEFPDDEIIYHTPMKPTNKFDLKIKAAIQPIDNFFRPYLKH